MITEKKCKKCNLIKPVSDFGKEKRIKKTGLKARCKECLNSYDRDFYASKYSDIKIAMVKSYAKNNQEAIQERRLKYYATPVYKEQKKKYNFEYRNTNREALRPKWNEAEKRRVREDPEYRLIKNLRKLIYRLKVEKKNGTEELLGFSYSELITHLGRSPEKNESLDHKVPVSWFIIGTDPKIIHSLFNLQILTRSQNSIKSNTSCCPISYEYYTQILPHIKLQKIKLLNYGKGTLETLNEH